MKRVYDAQEYKFLDANAAGSRVVWPVGDIKLASLQTVSEQRTSGAYVDGLITVQVSNDGKHWVNIPESVAPYPGQIVGPFDVSVYAYLSVEFTSASGYPVNIMSFYLVGSD